MRRRVLTYVGNSILYHIWQIESVKVGDHNGHDALAVRQRGVDRSGNIPWKEPWLAVEAAAFLGAAVVDFLGGILVLIVSPERRVSNASNEGLRVEIDRLDVVVRASKVNGVGAPRAPKRGEATYLTAATEQVHPDQLLHDTFVHSYLGRGFASEGLLLI
jgi:hypothetical protein